MYWHSEQNAMVMLGGSGGGSFITLPGTMPGSGN